MKPLEFPLLADENIGPDVVAGLRLRGCDLRTSCDEQLIGHPDVDVLERAASLGRVVVTHDIAFGRSAGHISAEFVLDVVDALGLRGSTLLMRSPLSAWLRNGSRNLQHAVDHRQIDFQACSFNHSDISPSKWNQPSSRGRRSRHMPTAT